MGMVFHSPQRYIIFIFSADESKQMFTKKKKSTAEATDLHRIFPYRASRLTLSLLQALLARFTFAADINVSIQYYTSVSLVELSRF
jgi:hypothetical protein